MKTTTLYQLALGGAAFAAPAAMEKRTTCTPDIPPEQCLPVGERDAEADPWLGTAALFAGPEMLKEFTNGQKRDAQGLPEPSLLEKFGIGGILTGNEKREAEAQDVVPLVLLSEEKRDLAERDAKGGANTAAIVGGLTGSAALVTLQNIFSKRDAEAQDVVPLVLLSEEKRDLDARDPEAKGGQITASVIGGLTSAAGLVGLQSLFSGNEKRDADPQEVVPLVFLSEEEKRGVEARDPKGGANTAAVIGGLTSAAGLVGLQTLFSGSEKRDAEAQDVLPLVFLSEEEKRDLIARDAKGGANTAAVIGGLTSAAGLVGLQSLFSGSEKRDAEAQDVVPVVFLSEEEKRDLITRDAKGGKTTAAVLNGVTGAGGLVGLRLATGTPATGPKNKRDAKGGQNTAAIIGGGTSAAGLVGLQSLFSGNEKRDAQGVVPIVFQA